ncbi:unnamed protein product [Lepidochelys olivacea]
MAEVSYLGHRVGSGRLKPEPAKVEVIRDWPAPHTKKQVQAFIGMAGYYRRFLPRFSAIATPITELCKKGKPDKVVWTEQCQEAFQALKEALVSGPVLANFPDFQKPFAVFTDASDTGLGVVLTQEDEKGERHPIVYLSKKLLPREQHYAAIEKECLALVWALKKLEPYLFGRHFTVYTDHSPLTWLHQMKGANAKLLRWSLLLQDYNMDVVHVKGSANLIVDALSRRGGPELPQVTGLSDPAQFSLEGGRDVTQQGGGSVDLGMCPGDGRPESLSPEPGRGGGGNTSARETGQRLQEGACWWGFGFSFGLGGGMQGTPGLGSKLPAPQKDLTEGSWLYPQALF